MPVRNVSSCVSQREQKFLPSLFLLKAVVLVIAVTPSFPLPKWHTDLLERHHYKAPGDMQLSSKSVCDPWESEAASIRRD